MNIEAFLETLRPLSETYGTGDSRGDLLFVLSVLLVGVGSLLGLFLIAGGRRRSAASRIPEKKNEGFDRYSSLAGKFEKLEMNSNSARTELMREVELLKVRVDSLENTVRILSSGGRTTLESFSPPPVHELSEVDDYRESPKFDRGEIPDLAEHPIVGAFDRREEVPARGSAELSRSSSSAEMPRSSFFSDDSESQPTGGGGRIEEVGSLEGVSRPTVFLSEEHLVETRASHAIPAPVKTAESLSEGLVKTRSGIFRRIREVFSGKPTLNEEMVEELQAFLVSTDLGLKMVKTLTDDLKGVLKRGDEVTELRLLERLKELVKIRLSSISNERKPIIPERRNYGPLVVMMVGVNGVGKTTTTAKLAKKWKDEGARVLLVAADTFRAAATEQLKRWGTELGIPVQAGEEGGKPGAVVYDAMERASEEQFDVVLIDTAGRLHTKGNLMQELEGIKNIVRKNQINSPEEILLVIDGTTGQNALSQAKEFHSAVHLTGLVVTKLDGTSKGGIVVAVQDEYGLPVRYIGVGESSEDLKPFEVEEFVDALFDENALQELAEPSAHAQTRRRRREDAISGAETLS